MRAVKVCLEDDEGAMLDAVRAYVQAQLAGAVRVGEAATLRWCLVTTVAALGLVPEAGAVKVDEGGDDHDDA